MILATSITLNVLFVAAFIFRKKIVAKLLSWKQKAEAIEDVIKK